MCGGRCTRDAGLGSRDYQRQGQGAAEAEANGSGAFGPGPLSIAVLRPPSTAVAGKVTSHEVAPLSIDDSHLPRSSPEQWREARQHLHPDSMLAFILILIPRLVPMLMLLMLIPRSVWS